MSLAIIGGNWNDLHWELNNTTSHAGCSEFLSDLIPAYEACVD